MESKGIVLWLTGLSGAGKTTIAKGLERKLKGYGYLVEVLDGDVIRTNLSKGLGFSREDRDINIRRIGFVANLLSRNGVVVIVAAITPYRAARDELRKTTENFIEVYVNAPLEVCEARDIKGLYAMARAGEIRAFTGIDDPYEEPRNPDIVCYTSIESIKQSIAKVIAELERLNHITKTSHQQSEEIQNIRCECTLDGSGYKEYEVFLNDQPLGIISWKSDTDNLKRSWYTTASDGYPCYFQTQEEAIDFLKSSPSESVTKLSAKLKTEAHKLTLIAEGLDSESIDFEVQDADLWEQMEEVKVGVEELGIKLKDARTEHHSND